RLVEVAQPVDYRLRLLGGGGVVEVDQRLAVDLLPQDGEVLADAPHLQRWRRRGVADLARQHGGDGVDAHDSSRASGSGGRWCTARRVSASCRRSGSTLTLPMRSLAKA